LAFHGKIKSPGLSTVFWELAWLDNQGWSNPIQPMATILVSPPGAKMENRTPWFNLGKGREPNLWEIPKGLFKRTGQLGRGEPVANSFSLKNSFRFQNLLTNQHQFRGGQWLSPVALGLLPRSFGQFLSLVPSWPKPQLPGSFLKPPTGKGNISNFSAQRGWGPNLVNRAEPFSLSRELKNHA